MGRRNVPVNEDYFAQVDSEPKAYFLGLLAANSSIVADRLQVTQDRAREALVRTLYDALGATSTVGFTRESVRFTVRSEPLVRDLARGGVHPRRDRRNTSVPWHGPQHLQRHYWRGYCDGKGGFVAGDSHFYVYGRWPMLRAFASFVQRETGLMMKLRPSQSDAAAAGQVQSGFARFEIHVRVKADVSVVADLLYTGAKVSAVATRQRAEAQLERMPRPVRAYQHLLTSDVQVHSER